MIQKKLLITGASGFVGGYLVQAALDAGYEVFAGLRKTSSRKYLQDPRIRFFVHDFDNAVQLANDLSREKFDYIIHNVGLTAAPTLERLTKVNKGTLQILIECLRSRKVMCKRLILTSSLAAYGPADFADGACVTNNDTPHPVTNYGRSKLSAETYLKKQKDVPFVIIRPTAVYGPHDHEFLPVYQSVKSHLKLLVGLHEQELTLVYVKDLANVFVKALEQGKDGQAYFVTDGKTHSTAYLNDTVANVLNKWAITIRLPIIIVKAIAYLSESLGSITGKYPVLNVDKVEELKAKSWACDIGPTVTDLDYKPAYTLERGITETINWCKVEKLL